MSMCAGRHLDGMEMVPSAYQNLGLQDGMSGSNVASWDIYDLKTLLSSKLPLTGLQKTTKVGLTIH